MADEIHVADIGATLQIEVTKNNLAIDISSYTTLEIIVEYPDATTTTFTASTTTDGTDGLMEYVTTAAGDLPQAGNHRMQGRLAKASPLEDFKTEIVSFEVKANL